MFGLSFAEIFVIGLVALIVIGPERLPKVARTVGLLFGRAQRYVNTVKTDIQREMDVEDIKNIKDEMSSAVSEMKNSFEEQVSSLKQPLEDVKKETETVEKQLKSELNPLSEITLPSNKKQSETTKDQSQDKQEEP